MKKGVKSEKQIEGQIQSSISSRFSDLKLRKDVTVGEMNADFYLQSPTGTTSIIQIKNWEPTDVNQERARDLASLYKTLSSADNVYIVMPGLARSDSDPENGVIALNHVNRLPKHLLFEPKKENPELPKVQKAPQKTVFAAMPFAGNYDDTFEIGIQGACLQLGYKAVRVDHQSFVGDIVAEIKRLIKKSVAVVGDLSDGRPNVLYEIGYAEAARRKVIQICSTPMDKIPFDVRNNRTLSYELGRTNKLKQDLMVELKKILPKQKQ
jgi:hypothetical protein